MNDDKKVLVGTLLPPPNPWERISVIAEKLGVKPIEKHNPTGISVNTKAGRYDLWEVIETFLDRMDKNAP